MNIKDIIIYISIAIIIYLMYRINHFNIDFFSETKEDLFTKQLANELRQIDPVLNEKFKELKFYDGQNRSYCLDKKAIYLCKVNKDGMMYDKNQLVIVLLHELAHTLCPNAGHTPEFQAIFEDLLQKAEQHGLYDPSLQTDPDYCTY